MFASDCETFEFLYFSYYWKIRQVSDLDTFFFNIFIKVCIFINKVTNERKPLMTGGFISMLDIPRLFFHQSFKFDLQVIENTLVNFWKGPEQGSPPKKWSMPKMLRSSWWDHVRRAVFLFCGYNLEQNWAIACTVDGEITMEKVKALIKMRTLNSFSSVLSYNDQSRHIIHDPLETVKDPSALENLINQSDNAHLSVKVHYNCCIYYLT